MMCDAAAAVGLGVALAAAMLAVALTAAIAIDAATWFDLRRVQRDE